jgi:uncharacterized protein
VSSRNLLGGCRPWGPAASLAWAFAATILWLGFQVIVGERLAVWFFDGDLPSGGAKLASNAPFVILITLSAAIVPLAVIALAVRMARCDLASYLGLQMPDRRYLVFGIAALAILIPLVDLISWLAGYSVTPQFVVDIYRSSRESGVLVLLAIALVVAAPVVEETMFRGFLLPSLAQSRLGPLGAILFTSAAWALLHAQYQPFYLLQIVVLGALFGWLRLQSGSLLLTILLHGIVNSVALVQAAIFAQLYS